MLRRKWFSIILIFHFLPWPGSFLKDSISLKSALVRSRLIKSSTSAGNVRLFGLQMRSFCPSSDPFCIHFDFHEECNQTGSESETQKELESRESDDTDRVSWDHWPVPLASRSANDANFKIINTCMLSLITFRSFHVLLC